MMNSTVDMWKNTLICSHRGNLFIQEILIEHLLEDKKNHPNLPHRNSYFWHCVHLYSEKAMAPHSSTLAWKIPWTEELGRLQSMLRVGHDSATSLSLLTFHFHALEKEMATHSSVLAWRIPGTGEPGRLPSMGSHRVEHDWGYLAHLYCFLYLLLVLLYLWLTKIKLFCKTHFPFWLISFPVLQNWLFPHPWNDQFSWSSSSPFLFLVSRQHLQITYFHIHFSTSNVCHFFQASMKVVFYETANDFLNLIRWCFLCLNKHLLCIYLDI